MSNKFNANALAEYCRAFARRLCNEAYQNQSVVSGRQLLELAPVSQTNLLIISNLYDKWKTDVEKFRSPYFDYTHPEVQEALQGFMNTVSQHIAIRREHLEPMLADATRRTLILIFDPRSYFDELIRSQPDFELTADAARQITRYTQINKFIPTAICQKISDKPSVYVNQALTYLDEVLTQRGHELEQYDKFVTLFSDKVPLNIHALLRNHVPDAIPAPPGRSFFDAIEQPQLGAGTDAPALPAALADPFTEPQQLTTSRPDTTQNPTEQPLQTLSIQAEPDENEEAEPTGPLTINDRLRQIAAEAQRVVEVPAAIVVPVPEPAPVAESPVAESTVAEPVMVVPVPPMVVPEPAPAPVVVAAPAPEPPAPPVEPQRMAMDSINKSISLNQKFRFINQLFNGNTMSYNSAMDELDKTEDYSQALDLVSYRYAAQYLWDMSSDEVGELVDILKRRFNA
jgi:hypothetical protein